MPSRTRSVATACCALLIASSALTAGHAQGRVAISLAESGQSAAFSTGGEVPLGTAVAQWEDLAKEDCRILTVCLSDLADIDCEKASSITLRGSSFVVIMGARFDPGANLSPGQVDDFGVIVRADGARFAKHCPEGHLTLTGVAGEISGAFDFADGHLDASGTFVVEQPAEPR